MIKKLLHYLKNPRYKQIEELVARFEQQFSQQIFDVKDIDEKLKEITEWVYFREKIHFKKFKRFKNEYGIFFTEIYNTGGHTQCITNLAKSLYQKTNQKTPLYISKLKKCYKHCKTILKATEQYSKIYGCNTRAKSFTHNLISMYNKIIDTAPKAIFVFTHMDDYLMSALLYLLKRNTDIKIIFFNHASHYPSLGMTFADLILEGTKTTEKITQEKRKLTNTSIIGLQSKAKDETIYYSKEELIKIRQNLGIKDNELMTISGGASYKFFDENTSKYFEMIKDLLKEKQNLKHVIMTDLDENQKDIVNKIFSNSEEKERLIISPLSADFEKVFQSADLYIDSFPVSSALTQIDLMRLKVATTVKINKEKPHLSFHEYMPQNYPYMSDNINEYKKIILFLLDNPDKRQEIIKSNYDFWLNTYEQNIVRDNYIAIANELINNIEFKNFKNIDYKLQLKTLDWRNSKDVSKYFKIAKIEKETHIKWLESLKKDNPKNIAYMIYRNKEPIGVTYFHSIDYSEKKADWGIYINDINQRNKGIGDIALKYSINCAKMLGLQKIYLDVLNTNKKAISLYEKNNFKQIASKEELFYRYMKII